MAGRLRPTSNIVFENMTISSQDDAEAWSKAQWVTNARNGFWALSSAGGANAKCISFTGSHISNVRFGAGLLAAQLLFSNNQIDHFGDDGIDFAASNIAITHNDLHDNLGIDGNHEDAMQGVIGVLPKGATVNHLQNILIDSNLIIRQTDPELSFPTYLQGIDAFDSDWTNMTITNNVIITSSCYAIQAGSVHGGLVAGNTGVDDHSGKSSCVPGIDIGNVTHEGTPSTNTRVANNLGERFTTGGLNDMNVTYDHNVALSTQSFIHVANGKWVFGEPFGTDANGNVTPKSILTEASQFVTWNPAALNFFLALKSGSVAIGAGTATGTPTVDILGVARAAPYTAGAYGYPH